MYFHFSFDILLCDIDFFMRKNFSSHIQKNQVRDALPIEKNRCLATSQLLSKKENKSLIVKILSCCSVGFFQVRNMLVHVTG